VRGDVFLGLGGKRGSLGLASAVVGVGGRFSGGV
jgi:hypothetical protein